MYKYVVLLIALFAFGCGSDDEMTDPCADVICQNGGMCTGGECGCALGYEGNRCQTERVPTSLVIESIKVVRWPANDGNDPWDSATDNPDLYIDILDGDEDEVFETSTFFEDVPLGQSVEWDDLSVNLANPSSNTYIIRLFDRDNGPFDFFDDFMGGIQGTFWNPGDGFSESIEVDANGDVAFRLNVRYVF